MCLYKILYSEPKVEIKDPWIGRWLNRVTLMLLSSIGTPLFLSEIAKMCPRISLSFYIPEAMAECLIHFAAALSCPYCLCFSCLVMTHWSFNVLCHFLSRESHGCISFSGGRWRRRKHQSVGMCGHRLFFYPPLFCGCIFMSAMFLGRKMSDRPVAHLR